MKLKGIGSMGSIGIYIVVALGCLGSYLHAELPEAVHHEKKNFWFKSQPSLFQPFLANPRQIGFSLAHRCDDPVISQSVTSISMGGALPFWNYKGVERLGNADIEIGIQGNVWSCFDIRSHALDLVNSDWMGGIPISIAKDNWAVRACVYHISSHLGDEYMISHPDIVRVNPSYEAIDISYSYNFDQLLRLYATVGHIIHSDSSFPMHKSYLEGGFETFGSQYKFSSIDLHAQPYFASHVRAWEMHSYEPEINVVFGLKWTDALDEVRGFSSSVEYYNGHSLEGQFAMERTNYLSFRIGYLY